MDKINDDMLGKHITKYQYTESTIKRQNSYKYFFLSSWPNNMHFSFSRDKSSSNCSFDLTLNAQYALNQIPVRQQGTMFLKVSLPWEHMVR